MYSTWIIYVQDFGVDNSQYNGFGDNSPTTYREVFLGTPRCLLD